MEYAAVAVLIFIIPYHIAHVCQQLFKIIRRAALRGKLRKPRLDNNSGLQQIVYCLITGQRTNKVHIRYALLGEL
ncbi:hypothetical protein SDC9_178179 [bioreactor metagenome]|uniref:Uncharacterized protein n=1 Tax=bioreactor metagenome TaxID=1076179 RepID=A0A645GV81_9ZZZZ